MSKFNTLALLAICALATSSVYAADGCCAGASGKMTKQGCEATFANLNLTPAQKSKMDRLAADCMSGGCNEATMAKMEKGARGVLTKKQFASWKTSCSHKGEHGQS
ncbi:MAG: hypothetical protein ACR2ID_07790 [Chthoniobacterales bacterium]